MWTFVGWETESVWGTLWLNFLSRELPGTSINNTATPLRLTPHTQRQFLFLKDLFQRPALKAVLHIATCNCLGPVRQVIKTIEKCPVALHLPDNLFLICVNRNFDTALPSSKNICQTKMPMRESYACVVFVFSMISTQIDSSFLVFINLSILAKKIVGKLCNVCTGSLSGPPSIDHCPPWTVVTLD